MERIDKKNLRTLHDAVALLGGKDDILDIINDLNNPNQEEVFRKLSNWNMDKIGDVKDRLYRCATQKVIVKQD